MINKMKNKISSIGEYKTLLQRSTKYCFLATGALFVCYLYVVGAITFSVVERKGLEESTKTLLSDISGEELKYLSKEKELTKELAFQEGFVSASSIAFTSAKRAVAWNAGR